MAPEPGLLVSACPLPSIVVGNHALQNWIGRQAGGGEDGDVVRAGGSADLLPKPAGRQPACPGLLIERAFHER